jgi:hypothetical protein
LLRYLVRRDARAPSHFIYELIVDERPRKLASDEARDLGAS